MAGFTQNGVKLQASVASTMAALLPAAGPAGAAIATAIGGAAFVMEVLEWLGNDDTVSKAQRQLQLQIDHLKFVLQLLEERMNELVDQVAKESNRQTNRDLLDYLDEIRSANTALQSPSLNASAAVRIANDSGVTLDKFLRNDFDIWRWMDVIAKEVPNPQTGEIVTSSALLPLQFKNLPTLPIYLTAVLTWLDAREKAIALGGKAQLDDDAGRIARHLAAVSVRHDFDKYLDDDPRGIPRSIAENIQWHIRALPIALHRQPVDRVCSWRFELQNWMNGHMKYGDNFDIVMPSDNMLCTIDPASLGAPPLELDAETESGIEALHALKETLERVSATGSIKQQFIGQFPNTEVYFPAVLYVIAQNADLHWYCNDESNRPGGSSSWRGPVKIGNGWGGFTTVFSGGGAAIYAVRPDGVLLWYGHDGFWDGTPQWREPRQVGHGWNGFATVFSGGEYVIYGIQPDGDLIWYRHDGASYGGDVGTWASSVKVGWGWGEFAKVFSGGDGIIYAIRQDGVLMRYKHLGYLTGAMEWEPHDEIGTGWNGFQEVVAAADGVLYAFTRDGRILWYRYGERKKTSKLDWKKVRRLSYAENLNPRRPGETFDRRTIDFTNLDLNPNPDWRKQRFLELESNPHIFDLTAMTWEGPVEIKRGLPGFRSAFALMKAPFRGPN